MKSVNMSRNLWYRDYRQKVRANPNENTDSGQRHQYIKSPFGEFKCLLFVHFARLSIS